MKTKNVVVSETSAGIQAATGLESRHMADLEKSIAAAYDAGQKAASPVEIVAPLSDGEIATVRAHLRSVAKKK